MLCSSYEHMNIWLMCYISNFPPKAPTSTCLKIYLRVLRKVSVLSESIGRKWRILATLACKWQIKGKKLRMQIDYWYHHCNCLNEATVKVNILKTCHEVIDSSRVSCFLPSLWGQSSFHSAPKSQTLLKNPLRNSQK